jgi:Asp-tRNA(Asn)/Glu-tRNA(Gln) amidotransferase B subunit
MYPIDMDSTKAKAFREKWGLRGQDIQDLLGTHRNTWGKYENMEPGKQLPLSVRWAVAALHTQLKASGVDVVRANIEAHRQAESGGLS